jgi:membrane fusion protein, multidrug efflux system
MGQQPRLIRRRLLIWLVSLGSIILPVVGATLYHILQTSQDDARAAGLPIPVQTVPATVQAVDEVIGGSGTIQPSMLVSVTAKVIARVLRVAVKPGTVVYPGDLLVEFDPELYRANFESAQLAFEHFHNELERAESLSQKRFASSAQLENARIDEARARVALVSAKIDLENTKIVSSVSAVVLSRSVNPGEVSHIDEPLIELGVLNPVLMEVAVSEDEMPFVYPGMHAEVQTDAFPQEILNGAVSEINSSVDLMTRTFQVYATLPNNDLRLKKGVTGYARMRCHRSALVVPNTAVVNATGDRAIVYVVDGSQHAHIRDITPGLRANGMTEILAGLHEAEQVVSVGQAGLRDNDEVRLNQNAPWNRP